MASILSILSRIILLCACLLVLSTQGEKDHGASDEGAIGEFFEEIGFFQSIKATKIVSLQSEYQAIEIYQSDYYGKILSLDGVLQLTERDADAYNEMLSHIPLFQHARPKRVLVLGGGDGYVLSEVLKHESVEHVDHVDLDSDVIKMCKEHFPWGAAWNDPRVNLVIADGAAFARDAADASYDVIIQDSSDPWSTDSEGNQIVLPSSALYEERHFQNLNRILSPNGILNLQAETFTIPSDLEGIVHWRQQALEIGFTSATYGSIYISSYPTGQIGFLLLEKSPKEAAQPEDMERRYQSMRQAGHLTSYYHPRLQKSAFDLPLWVHDRVYGSTESVPVDKEL